MSILCNGMSSDGNFSKSSKVFHNVCTITLILKFGPYCNYILFTKLPWPGDSEGTFRSSSQAATCPPVYHTRRRLHTVPLIAERQAGKLVNTNFYSLWFDPTENRTRVYRFSSRRSIHSTTNR